jgi:4'-phosphopantetheinyl transferase
MSVHKIQKMGVIINKDIDGCKFGIWKISEDYYTLYSMLSLDMEEIAMLNGFGNENRKVEWLSVRALANEMTGKDSRIIYNDEHKPFLKGMAYNISISHSRNMTSILMSKTSRVGIDLEYMSHKIGNLSNKFVNDQEYITNDPDTMLYHLYLHWCGKEAIYKICDKQDINFKENLTLFPFEPKQSGTLKGRVLNDHGLEGFVLKYQMIEGYAIVWTSK